MAQRPPMRAEPRSPNRGGYPGTRKVEAIVLHISQGTNSLGWLCNPASQASANYLIARDGTIYELVPPNEDAWGNGIVDNPDTSNPLIARWLKEGVNFNQRTVSIEHEGFTSNNRGGSLTPAQIDATVHLTAWLCFVYRLTPDRTHILRHSQVDSVNRPYCPGFSEDEMTDWVLRAAALVKGAQPVDEQAKRRALLKAYADTIPVAVRGELVREGSVDLRGVGGAQDERIALYERLCLHSLAGRASVFRRDVADVLQAPWSLEDVIARKLVHWW